MLRNFSLNQSKISWNDNSVFDMVIGQ